MNNGLYVGPAFVNPEMELHAGVGMAFPSTTSILIIYANDSALSDIGKTFFQRSRPIGFLIMTNGDLPSQRCAVPVSPICGMQWLPSIGPIN